MQLTKAREIAVQTDSRIAAGAGRTSLAAVCNGQVFRVLAPDMPERRLVQVAFSDDEAVTGDRGGEAVRLHSV